MDNDCFDALRHAYDVGGFRCRSDYARQNAEAVAEAAIRGLLTTEVPGEGYGAMWRPTALGIDALNVFGGRPSSLYAHGGLPDAFLNAVLNGGERASTH